MSVFDEPKVDTHCHVLDPARFAYAGDTAYRPAGQELGTAEQYLAVMAAYGIEHALLVGPNSGYGLDNRCLLDALERWPARLRGIAVLAPDTDRATLAALRARGVVGAALNATVLGVAHCLASEPLLRRLAGLDMVLSLQAEGDQLAALAPLVERSGVRTMVDHCGRPAAGLGIDQPGFRALLGLADRARGRVAVKLSGWQKFSALPPPWPDTRAFADALLGAFGLDACVWASDWPFLRARERLDVGPLLRHVEALLPEPADRRRLFWDTPRRWLGLGDPS